MRIHAVGFVGLLFVFGPAYAAPNSPPSDASLHELMQVTQVHKMLDATMAQMDGMIKKESRQAMAGHPVDAGEQKIIDAQTSKLKVVMMQQLSWKKMEPMFISIYRKTFTQKEVDDMLVFDRSPSGQSMIAKTPAMMAQVMQTVQDEMSNLIPQMSKVEMDMVTSLNAYEASKKQAPRHSSTGKASRQQVEKAVEVAPKSTTRQLALLSCDSCPFPFRTLGQHCDVSWDQRPALRFQGAANRRSGSLSGGGCQVNLLAPRK